MSQKCSAYPSIQTSYMIQGEVSSPFAGRSSRARPHKEDTSTTSCMKLHPLCWSLPKSSPSQGGHQRCLPVSGRHWCGMVSISADPGSLACQMLGPADRAVCVPCCPFIATFLAEDVYFYAPVAQLYVSPCLMCHFPLLSQVK